MLFAISPSQTNTNAHFVCPSHEENAPILVQAFTSD